MTFKWNIEVIGFVNEQCGGLVMLVREVESMFTQSRYHQFKQRSTLTWS